METPKFKTPTFSTLTSKVNPNRKKEKAETNHVFKDIWAKNLTKSIIKKQMEQQRLKLQLQFAYIYQVKTYTKEYLKSIKQRVKKLFKRVKIKVKAKLIPIQLTLSYGA